jgi:23S rRNA U2552 (ribose-2'-O)-methylase RlmE/FtsJ
MDISGNKPPWESTLFLASPSVDELLESLSKTTFGPTWKEINHDPINEIKKRIEPLEANHSWESLKKKTNPYELVYTQESQESPTSICILKPLSRSYFKMIEMLHVLKFFERLPKTSQKVSSAHVAEGPGGFIEAFLDKASDNRLLVSRSLAMTLKPTTNHIPGWRRTFSYLQKHPEIKIHYGEDGTGNIYVPENQKSFVGLCEQRVHLFTGDGGFDFSVDYEKQERSIYPLLVASAIIGIQVLLVDGVFVLKLFDIFSVPTHYFLRIVSLCFKEWTLYKPSTSRPCNSERYLLCRGFRRGPSSVALLEHLVLLQKKFAEGEYPQTEFFSFFTEKEKEFLESHMAIYSSLQSKTLIETINLQNTPSKDFSWKPHHELAVKWCRVFRVPTVTKG